MERERPSLQKRQRRPESTSPRLMQTEAAAPETAQTRHPGRLKPEQPT
ncbi:hypothetical protein NEIFL0001_2201 [Neisseria flavescens SK114]|nr:hypothetical protein NEIFL0001_2201 [Neisseria flavescens SK114]